MSWSKYFVAVIALLSLQNAKAQEVESAPQEAPYIQEENEFDSFVEEAKPDQTTPMTIEDDVPTTPKPNKTVDLNKTVPEAGGKQEEIIFEDQKLQEGPKVPVAEEPSATPGVPVVEAATEPKVERAHQVGRGGVEYIHHPQAAKGLLAITKDGAYIYKTSENRDFHQTGTFRFAAMDAPKIVAADGTTFEAMYQGSQQHMLMFDYEWQPFTTYGKLGVQAGFGLLYATGKGRFVSSDPSVNGQEAKEKYTFLAVPLNLGAIYRLEWLSRQWLAPYVSGGGTYIGIAEFRDDGKTPSAVGTPGAYGAAGMLFNISAMDRETAFVLNTEYGIANLWVSVEYRYLQTFSEDLDFTSNILSAGIAVDY